MRCGVRVIGIARPLAPRPNPCARALAAARRQGVGGYVLLSGLLPPSAMAAAGNDAVLVAEIGWIAATGVCMALLLGMLRIPP